MSLTASLAYLAQGAAANLGIMADTHMTKTEYNALGTVFYASVRLNPLSTRLRRSESKRLTRQDVSETPFCSSYLFFCFPQSWALQRFHIGKWMAANVLVWGVALFAHAACKNFAGLLVCRLILGACEGTSCSKRAPLSPPCAFRRLTLDDVPCRIHHCGLPRRHIGLLSTGRGRPSRSESSFSASLLAQAGLLTFGPSVLCVCRALRPHSSLGPIPASGADSSPCRLVLDERHRSDHFRTRSLRASKTAGPRIASELTPCSRLPLPFFLQGVLHTTGTIEPWRIFFLIWASVTMRASPLSLLAHVRSAP